MINVAGAARFLRAVADDCAFLSAVGGLTVTSMSRIYSRPSTGEMQPMICVEIQSRPAFSSMRRMPRRTASSLTVLRNPSSLGLIPSPRTPSILKRKIDRGVASVAVEDAVQDGTHDVVGAAAMVASVVQWAFA